MKKTIKIAFFALLAFGLIFNACRQLTQIYKVDSTKCTSCYKCVSVCGYGAITIKQVKHTSLPDEDGFTFEYPTTVVIDSTKCVGCGECFKSCPSQAISLVVTETDGTSGASKSNND